MKKTVLVVDDDVYNLSVAKKLMEDSYEVIGVSGGESCLKVLSRRTPSLILLDIDMPNMNGFEVLEKIRENNQWEDLPVIFLTANTDVKTEQKCLEIGAVDYIRKPFEPTIMLSRVGRSIQLYSLSHHLQEVIDEKTSELERLNFRFTREIVDIVEGRDNDTGNHVQRTCGYVKMIVKSLYEKKLYPEVITETSAGKIERAAALHDIGKIRISDVVLNKPGKLTAEEFKTMQYHVVYEER